MGDFEGDEKGTGSGNPSDSGAVTIRVPKKVLAAAAIIVLVVIAFLIGRGCGENSDPSSSPDQPGSGNPVVSDNDCPDVQAVALAVTPNLKLAKNAESKQLLQDRFGPGTPSDAQFEVVGCDDLNGDGQLETVALATNKETIKGPPMSSWFILDSDLEVIVRRTVPDPQLEITAEGVRESTGTYEPTDSNTPTRGYQETGRRMGLVKWDGDSYTYVPDQGSRQRIIKTNNEGKVEQLGPFRDFSTSPPLASDGIATLGPPSTISGGGAESCSLIWYDLGLQILFVTFGRGSGCTSGYLQSAYVFDDVGRMAGWNGPFTLRVGQTIRQVKAAFPMVPLGYGQKNDYVLVYGAYPYGGDPRGTPTVIGNFVGHRLFETQFWTGAAGD